MFKEIIKYVDFNGTEREEEFYFNLTKAEVMEMELSIAGGMTSLLKRVVASQDNPEIIDIFKSILLKSYGVKSLDGRKFIKNQEVVDDFVQTEAFSEMFIRLATDAEYASKFINGVIPQVEAAEEENKVNGVKIPDNVPLAVAPKTET